MRAYPEEGSDQSQAYADALGAGPLGSLREWPALLERVTLAVAARAGTPVQAPPELASTPHRVQIIEMPASAISSTEVRDRASRGEDIRPMVGDAVAGYIARHRLYGAL